MRLVRGVTREVLLTRRWACKAPSVRCWRLFLRGLLANMQEAEWSGTDPRLCPVRFALRGGFLVVMPRVDVLTEPHPDMERCAGGLPVERKPSSFGWLDGRLVAIDYGS